MIPPGQGLEREHSLGAATGAFKTLRFSTDDFPQHKRIEAFREVYGRTIIKHDVDVDQDQPFRFDGMLYDLPGLGLASYVVTPCRAPRRTQHIDSDDFVFSVSFGGDRLVEQRGREAPMQAGEGVLTTAGDPGLVTIASTCRLMSLRLSGGLIRSAVSNLDTCLLRTVPHQNGALTLLPGYLDCIRDLDAFAKPQLRTALVEHIQDLVLLILGGAGEPREVAEQRGARAARRAAVLRAIASRSSDSGLSAAAIAAGLGVTPRYVHLLLEETGKSFGDHVLERRLDNAAALLRDPRWRDRKITDIADQAGFVDLSYFNRTFRRRYGVTPSDIRETARRERAERN